MISTRKKLLPAMPRLLPTTCGHSPREQESKRIARVSAYMSYIMISRVSSNCHGFRWVSDLPRAFERYGLTHISVSRVHEHRWHTRALTEMNLVLADNFANHLDVAESPGSANTLRQLAKRVYAEIEQGAGIEQTLQVVIGRKAFLAEREM